MGVLERFLESEVCPKQHDRYVKKGWHDHLLYCMCDCSYCLEGRLRRDTGESGETYDKEKEAEVKHGVQ